MRDARRGGLGIALVGVLLVAGLGVTGTVAGALSDASVVRTGGPTATTAPASDASGPTFEASGVGGNASGAAIEGWANDSEPVIHASGPAVTAAVAAGPPAAGPPAAGQITAAATTQTSTITVEQELRLTPDRPGEVTIQQTYTIPDRIISLNATIPENATVVSADGFERVAAGTYGWDGRTTGPALTYRYDVNRTAESGATTTGNRSYLSVDTGEWALFSRPATGVEYRATGSGPIGFERTTATAGPGVTGQWLVYLGEYRVERRTVHEQTFELVVPEPAELGPDAEAILDSLARASDSLRVGDRDEEVLVIAAPTAGVEWAVRGVQTGDSDVWVQDSEPLASPENVWLHEYVHTRQSYRPTRATRWFTEGSATYYAAMLSDEQNLTSYDRLRAAFASGAASSYDEVVLADPSTWIDRANYARGSLVLSHLDRRIRTATEQERTLQTVFREMNAHRGPVTQDRFLSFVTAAGGETITSLGRNYTTQAQNLTVWNRSQYLAAFSQTPARISASLPPIDRDSAYLVSGAYRNGDVGGENAIELVTGETLSIATRVRNDGGTEGSYNVSLAVNGTAVTTEGGRIGAGQRRTVLLDHTFPTPGRFRVSVGGENVSVVVRRPALASVTNLTVVPASGDYRQGGAVRASAMVHNDADIPGELQLVFTRDFEAVSRRTVALDANETRRIVALVRLPRPGNVRVGVNGVEEVRFDVEPAPVQTEGEPEPTPTPTARAPTTPTATPSATPTETTGPGFGVVAGLLALVAAGLLAARRRAM